MIYIPVLSDCAYHCLRGVIMVSHTPFGAEKTRAGVSRIDYDVFSTLMMIIIYVLLDSVRCGFCWIGAPFAA